MTIDELEQGLDRYGGDLGRWPGHLRAGAEALVSENRTAAELVRVAARLDRALARAVEPVTLDSAFVGSMVAGVGSAKPRDEVVRPTPRLAAWAGVAMAAFLVTGYAIGLALPATTTTQSDDVLASIIFGDTSATVDTGTAEGLGGLL